MDKKLLSERFNEWRVFSRACCVLLGLLVHNSSMWFMSLPYATVVVRYLEPKRKLPTFSAVVGQGSELDAYAFNSIYGFTVELTHNVTNSTAGINSYTADASITLAELNNQIYNIL